MGVSGVRGGGVRAAGAAGDPSDVVARADCAAGEPGGVDSRAGVGQSGVSPAPGEGWAAFSDMVGRRR